MKLHLGCGNKKIPGYINVDIIDSEAVDIVDNVALLESFKNNSVDIIYACHVLEHFKRKEYFLVLKRWTEILKSDGILRLSVPDFTKVSFAYTEKKIPLEKLLGFINGAQTYLYNFHYMNFDFDILERDLTLLNYKSIIILMIIVKHIYHTWIKKMDC